MGTTSAIRLLCCQPNPSIQHIAIQTTTSESWTQQSCRSPSAFARAPRAWRSVCLSCPGQLSDQPCATFPRQSHRSASAPAFSPRASPPRQPAMRLLSRAPDPTSSSLAPRPRPTERGNCWWAAPSLEEPSWRSTWSSTARPARMAACRCTSANISTTHSCIGLGIGIIGLTARQMINTGFVYRIMVTNPWVVGLGGLALSFGTMIGTRSISPDNYIPKYALWTAFNATQAALIAPMLSMVHPALLGRAGLYTVAMIGAISIVGATAKQEKYLYIGGPLLAGAAL